MAISSKDVKFYPLGDTAVILQFGESLSHQTQKYIFSISNYLEEYSFEGLVEHVPAYTSVTLFYDPLVVSYNEIIQNLEEMLADLTVAEVAEEVQLIDIPVLYGGEWGPDLETVASHSKISIEEVIERHTAVEYLVNMIGFAPGFPYLSGMDEALKTPRRTHPRAMVPAGSVGIAGIQTGVYPIATPGGWQIIGRSPLKLFDLARENPSLLKAGNLVRFVPITETDFNNTMHGN